MEFFDYNDESLGSLQGEYFDHLEHLDQTDPVSWAHHYDYRRFSDDDDDDDDELVLPPVTVVAPAMFPPGR